MQYVPMQECAIKMTDTLYCTRYNYCKRLQKYHLVSLITQHNVLHESYNKTVTTLCQKCTDGNSTNHLERKTVEDIGWRYASPHGRRPKRRHCRCGGQGEGQVFRTVAFIVPGLWVGLELVTCPGHCYHFRFLVSVTISDISPLWTSDPWDC